MGAVRVGEIARRVDLVGLHAFEEFAGDADVLFADGLLLDAAGFVEGQVEEVDVLFLDAAVASAGVGLGAADEPLDLLEFGAVGVAGVLAGQERLDVLLELVGELLAELREGVGELADEVDVAAGRVVPHGDVAAGLVGHVDFVPLVAEADEGAAHADDVVVGVGAEDDDALGERALAGQAAGGAQFGLGRAGGLAAGPAGDGVLEGAEDLDVEVVGLAAGGEEVLQAVLVVVLGGELEDGLAEFAGEPDDGPFGELDVPREALLLDAADEPRGLDAGEFRARGGVEDEGRAGVLLEERCGDGVGDLPLDGPLHDDGLVLAEGQQEDAAGVKDGAHAHGDGPPGHVPLAEEVAGRVHPRHLVERDESRAALARRARLVEADVAGAAHAQDLDVDPAQVADLALVFLAEGRDLLASDGAAGHVGVRRVDVDVVEEVLLHEAAVALDRVGLHRPVLVEVERHDVAEAQLLLAVQAHELVVDRRGRAARRQAQHRHLPLGGPLADQGGDGGGHRLARRRAGGVDDDRDLLSRADVRR